MIWKREGQQQMSDVKVIAGPEELERENGSVKQFRTVGIVLIAVFFSALVKDGLAEDFHPTIGFVMDDPARKYHLLFQFGMEVFDDGKLLDERHVWNLICDYPSWAGKKETSCSLEIGKFLKLNNGSIVTVDKYNTADNMKVKMADWEGGKLDLTFMWPADKSTTEVSILMSHDKKNIYLKSFRAVNVGKSLGSDKLTVTEYKIPDHTYVIDYPIAIWGLKPTEPSR